MSFPPAAWMAALATGARTGSTPRGPGDGLGRVGGDRARLRSSLRGLHPGGRGPALPVAGEVEEGVERYPLKDAGHGPGASGQ